jgi:hypothetical protein
MKKLFLLTGFVLSCVMSVLAQKSEIFKTSDGAIRGYDPVAYFKEGRPVKGDPKFTYTWKDSRWMFSSQKNLDLFKANPDQYAPQYGGYCAYGASQGHKATIDPQAWTIVGGKLYLNYDADIKTKWMKDQAGYIRLADKNWGMLKDKE